MCVRERVRRKTFFQQRDAFVGVSGFDLKFAQPAQRVGGGVGDLLFGVQRLLKRGSRGISVVHIKANVFAQRGPCFRTLWKLYRRARVRVARQAVVAAKFSGCGLFNELVKSRFDGLRSGRKT